MNKNGVPRSKLSRGSKVGFTALRVGASEAKLRIKNKLGASNEAADHQTRESQAKKIFKTLAELRGSALKAAQMLAQEVDLLPEAYQKELGKAWHQAPSLNRAVVRKVFMTQLGKPPEDCFDRFEPTAFAAASLGQVHDAVYQGQDWAVKIQYPGIGETITSDIQLLGTLFKTLRLGVKLQDMLEEVQDRFLEETDYIKEMAEMRYFKSQLKESLVQIAEPLEEFSTAKILVTQKIKGLHLEDWLGTNPSQDQRNHMGQLLIDLWEYGVLHLERLHADSNPGNYLFLPDGRLGLLDFGCIKKYEAGFAEKYKNFFRALLTENVDEILEALGTFGIVHEQTPEAKRDLLAMSKWYIRPYQLETFDLKAHQGYIKEGSQCLAAMQEHCTKHSKDFIFTDRTWLGVYRMLERMGAEVKLTVGRRLLWE